MTARRTLRTLILAAIASPGSRTPAPRPTRATRGSGGPGLRRARDGCQRMVRGAYLGGGQADRRRGLYRLRSDRLAAALVGFGARNPHPAAPTRRGSAPRPSCTRISGVPASTSSSTASTRRRATIPTRGSTRCGRARNSNTFTAWIARHVPELAARPAGHRHRKDYLGSNSVLHGAQRQRLSVLARRTAWHRGERRRRASKSTCSA